MFFNQPQTNILKPMPGYHYKIVSGLAQNMVLDVSQNPKDHDNLILFQYNHGKNQIFYFQTQNGKDYAIYNAQTKKPIEIPNANQSNDVRAVCSQNTSQKKYQWQLVPANFHGKKNAFHIKTFCGKALDVKGGVAQNQTHVIQWQFHGTSNQIWIIQKL